MAEHLQGGYLQQMRDDEFRYLSWTRTGPFLLVVGLIVFFMCLYPLIEATRGGSTGRAVAFALFVIAGAYNVVLGVRLVRRRRFA